MSEDLIYLDVEKLQTFIKDVFIGLGVPEEDANICSDVLITSDLFGIESHGVQRLKMYFERIKARIQSPITKITIIKETPTTARLDAGHGMGQVAAYRAMELAINKAKEYGTGAVSVGNSTHFGIAGYYSLMAIEKGMIGITISNARPSIAPTFGIEPILGANPFTIGIPTDEETPFLIDCSTSIAPRGKIEVYARANNPIPKGWVINEKGDFITDSVQILNDLKEGNVALLPLGGAGETLGGHKGYGYAAAVEILSAALWGGPFLKDLIPAKRYKLGHFFLAINVDSFIELDTFKKIASEICRALRNSRKAPNQERIYTAGEKEYEMAIKRRITGIPINKSVKQEFVRMSSELGLNYDFRF